MDLEGKLGFDFSFSYPASIRNDTIERTIKSKLSKGLQVECIHNYDPVYFDKNGFLCQTLKATYEKVTGMMVRQLQLRVERMRRSCQI